MSSTEPSEDERLQFPFRAIEPSTSPSLADSGQADPSPSTSGLSSIGHMPKGDIGVNIGSLTLLSDADKYALLVDPYVPPTIFPKHAEHGKQRSWLTKYPWLAYSRLLDGGFCLPCALFSRGGGGDRILVEKSMCKFTKASDHLKEHSQKRAHFVAIQGMESFRSVMEQSVLPIHHQLQSAVCLHIKRNREELMSILKTVVLCGKQNISFRGHRDDSKYLSEDS